jgi:hypothetical protein
VSGLNDSQKLSEKCSPDTGFYRIQPFQLDSRFRGSDGI